MAASSRSAQYNQLYKTLKKHYKPFSPPEDRPVLEHLLFASCLENAHYAAAEEAFAALVHSFYDFNEIRVSSVRELSEVLAGLPDPSATALHVKRVLQSVFEGSYSFDLEDLRKLNLGPAVERLEKINGTTRFSVACVIQNALGGHAIPADEGTLKALWTVDILSQNEMTAGTLPGVERAIPKNKGIEFGSLLHQLGADFTANPYSPQFHQILLQINPDIKDRLPKRRAKVEAPTPAPAPRKRSSAKAAPEGPSTAAAPPEPADAATPKTKKAAGKPDARKRKAETPPPAPVEPEESSAKKKPGATKKKVAGKKKPPEAKSKAAEGNPGKEAASAGLAKRKPR